MWFTVAYALLIAALAAGVPAFLGIASLKRLARHYGQEEPTARQALRYLLTS